MFLNFLGVSGAFFQFNLKKHIKNKNEYIFGLLFTSKSRELKKEHNRAEALFE